MDNVSNSLGFGTSSSDPKAAVMNQVRQEAALQNARQLIEVKPSSGSLWTKLTQFLEIKRTLLREVRSPARLLSLQRRTDLFHAVHGEVHGGMEYSQQAVHIEDTAGKWTSFGQRRNVLAGTIHWDGKII
jgi:hypothetical protein